MNFKKLLALILALVMITSGLAACDTGDDGTHLPTESVSESVPDQSESETDAEARI